MKRLYHTAKNRAAPLPHNGRGRLVGGYQPVVNLNKAPPPPRGRHTDVKARERHQFTFLPWEDDEHSAIRSVQRSERRKRIKAMRVGDRVAMGRALITAAYIMCRGVWWWGQWIAR